MMFVYLSTAVSSPYAAISTMLDCMQCKGQAFVLIQIQKTIWKTFTLKGGDFNLFKAFKEILGNIYKVWTDIIWYWIIIVVAFLW